MPDQFAGRRRVPRPENDPNLSYAPGTGCDVLETATMCGIYVTAVDPNKALPVMIDELKRALERAPVVVHLAHGGERGPRGPPARDG